LLWIVRQSHFLLLQLYQMAGYFSNHSQSQTRFSSTQQQQPQNNTTATTQQDTSRPRLPASRHFSTSLANRDPEPALTKTAGSSPPSGTVHPLRNTWVFWFRQQRAPGNKITNYEEGIKKVASFSSVSLFLSLGFHHPQAIPPGRILLVSSHSPFPAIFPPTHN